MVHFTTSTYIKNMLLFTIIMQQHQVIFLVQRKLLNVYARMQQCSTTDNVSFSNNQ